MVIEKRHKELLRKLTGIALRGLPDGPIPGLNVVISTTPVRVTVYDWGRMYSASATVQGHEVARGVASNPSEAVKNMIEHLGGSA